MIEVNIDPYLVNTTAFAVTWHGFFTFVAVITAVTLVTRWAPKSGIPSYVVQNTAIWAILGGIIGARIVHVVDYWHYYSENLVQIVALWNGGIGLFGAFLGGFVGGAIYAYIRKYPIGQLADITAPSLLMAAFIGRIGDIINGEHCAASTTSPLSISYLHTSSNAVNCANGLGVSVHPVIIYEMCWYLVIFVVIWKLRNRLAPEGMLFLVFLSLYAFGRFFITFLRDDRIWGLSLQEAQFISLIILFTSITWIIYRIRWVSSSHRYATKRVTETKKN